MTISILGIDIAKNTFQLHGADRTRKTVLRKCLPRHKIHRGPAGGLHNFQHIIGIVLIGLYKRFYELGADQFH